MLKSCQYCGRIHDSKLICAEKKVMLDKRKKKRFSAKDKFRSAGDWQDKRSEIRQRDKNLCQVCIRNLYGTVEQFNYSNLSVHHAIPLEQDYHKRLDNDNLITLCEKHHEMAESGAISLSTILNIIEEQKEAQ